MKKLTPKQARFVKEYLIDLNGTQAAIRAGYSKTPNVARATASEILAKPYVAAAVAEAKAKRAEKTDTTAEWVLAKLKKNAAVCMKEETPEGLEPTLLKYDGGAANGALGLIGKHLRMFPDRHEVSGPNGGPIQVVDPVSLKSLTADELERLELIYRKITGAGQLP